MELKTAIEILEYHQEWRLGKREDMIHEPKKLTEALDIVLSEVKKFRLGAVISRFSIEERFRLEEKLVKIVTDKRPYYKTVKKREVVRDTVSDLLDAIVQNGL
jgi:hypothetical protein